MQALDALAGVQLDLDRERLCRQGDVELLDQVLTAMSDSLILVDARGVVCRVNEAALRLFGRTRESLEGAPVEQLLEPDVPTSVWKLLELEPEGHLQLEIAVDHSDGRRRPVSLSCGVVRDSNGKVDGVLYLARDLSETHRLLAEVEEAHAHWRLLAQIGHQLSQAHDPEETLPAVCRDVSEATGLGTALILVTGSIVDRVVVHAGSMSSASEVQELTSQPLQARTALAGVIRDGRVVHAASLRPDFPLLRTGSPPGGMASACLAPLVARGSCLGAVLIFSDHANAVGNASVHIVEEVARRVALVVANGRLRTSLAELEAAQEVTRVRQDMLAGLSHDMKTPLGVIVGALDVLRSSNGTLPAERTRTLYDAMSAQAHWLRRLVLQFLDYAQLESGYPLRVNLCPTDVVGAIQWVVETSDARSLVEVMTEGELPPVMVDPDRFDQVLFNMLSNALKFSAPGSPVTIAAAQSGHQVRVSVTDQGRGISPNDLANLFEKYHRASSASDTGGTGLGLYMSRALIEAQGGSITVASRLGEGSAFSVLVPCAESQPAGAR
jgi:PAS domain S-box-containing protein